MIEIITMQTPVAVGNDGLATSNVVRPLGGDSTPYKVLAVHVTYQDSPPGTTDVTLDEVNDSDAVIENILTLTSQATAKKVYPAVAPVTAAEVAIIDSYVNKVIRGRLKLTIDQANAGDQATARIYLER